MSRIASAAALLLLALAPSATFAFNAIKLENGRIDNKIEHYEAIIEAGQRQALTRMNELKIWARWWGDVRNLAQAKYTDLKKNLDKRQKAASLAAATARAVTSGVDESRHYPLLGWHTTSTIDILLLNMRDESKRIAELIEDGKDNWHIAAVGWIAGGAIQGNIDGTLAEIQKIQTAVKDGSYTFHHPGIGWTTIGHWRRAIADAEKERGRIMASIVQGDYTVHIPGLGPYTRNKLDAEIAALEKNISDSKTAAKEGSLKLHRAAIGWATRKDLEKRLDEGEKSFDLMKKTVSDGLYKVRIPGPDGGWWTREVIDKKVKALEKQLVDTEKAIRAGTYKANVFSGWWTRNDLKKYVAEKEQALKDPKLDAQARLAIADQLQAARKGLTDLQKLSAMDVAVWGLQKSELLSWVATPLKYAKTDFRHREIVRDEMLAHVTDFDGELQDLILPLELRLNELREAGKYIPQKGRQ